MNKQTDTYTYDALDRLVGYTGYDGFEQQYTVDMSGLRTSMSQKGSTERYTLEDLLKGEAFRPELPGANIPTNQAAADALEPTAEDWEKTSYIYDITLPYGQMLTETTGGNTTVYTYGLERIDAVDSGGVKTQYVYDGRGSVAQSLEQPKAGGGKAQNGTSQVDATQALISSYRYTPFGLPMGEAARKTGFGYNGEYYDAATGMLNLRARQYEPTMGRFSQKDVFRGGAWVPQSLNRYAFVYNDPIGFVDPSGMVGLGATGTSAVMSYRKKVAEVYKKATLYARTAATAPEAHQKRYLKMWFDYCQKNAAYLTGDIKSQYEAAIGTLSDKNKKKGKRPKYEVLLEACLAISNNTKLTDEELYNVYLDANTGKAVSLEQLRQGLMPSGKTNAEIRQAVLDSLANDRRVILIDLETMTVIQGQSDANLDMAYHTEFFRYSAGATAMDKLNRHYGEDYDPSGKRKGALLLEDGTVIPVGYTNFPHIGSPGKLDLDDGHLDIYFGESNGGTDGVNELAEEARRMIEGAK